MFCTKDKQYNVSELKAVGWTIGDGTGKRGVSHLEYFDDAGVYLGPDEHGIEPIFYDESFDGWPR